MNSAGVLEGPEGDSLSPAVVAAPSVGVVPGPAALVPVASTPPFAVPLAASVPVASTPSVAVALGASSPEGTPEAAGAPEPVGEALNVVSFLVQKRKEGWTHCVLPTNADGTDPVPEAPRACDGALGS